MWPRGRRRLARDRKAFKDSEWQARPLLRLQLRKEEARRTQGPPRFSGVMRGASDAGESPWRRLRERAQKIPGDKKHDPGLGGFCHRVIAVRSSIRHRNARSNTGQN
jgi:hypothetical protein